MSGVKGMPAAPQGGGGGGQGDNSTGILWTVAAIFAGIAGVWYLFKGQIVWFYFTVKLYEVDFLNLVSNFFGQPYYFVPLAQTLEVARTSAAHITYTDVLTLGASVGDWMRIPFVVFLCLLGLAVYINNAARSFKRTYNMRDFIKLESKNWPQITPVVNLDLIKTDIDTGPWAMALTPMQFCKKYRLLEEVRPQRREGMSRKDWDKVEVVLKRGEANKLFAMQLGPLWVSPDRLPPYARALFAAFAARINADSKPAEKLFLQMAASSHSKNLNYAGVAELLKKHGKSKLVQQVVQSHAYVTTVLASMLQKSREDGVQASADFLWLKAMDRRLWYILNTVGRQTPFIEVAGIFAHWIAEKEAGRKLVIPMVEEATNAVEIALKEVIYKPDEEKA